FYEKSYGLLKTNPDMSPIHDLIKVLAVKTYQEGQSFAVNVKRSDKKFTISSKQLSIDLATTIFENSSWKNVNLKYADQFFYVNISSRGISVHTNKIKGTGGLPVSSTGRVLTLLSGGFDSPVAAWLMANRGCNVDFIHFSASHHNAKDVEAYKISRIVKKISEVSGRARLYIVPYTHFDMALMEHGLAYDLILFRRFMARVSEQIMQQIEAQALVTGDNLGQVASQTLENINSMNQAISAPILRPLITYNKGQIIEHSNQLGLFDICCEPYKDCCALISKNPRTKSKAELMEKLEINHLSNYEELMTDTLNETTQVIYNFGQLVEINQSV
ncbi:MAG: tRNA sulfurtransferase, partial [Marinicella sp.]